MGANKHSIWRAPAYLPYVQPPLTDAALADAERAIGYKLPQSFVDLLRVQNGGYIRYSLPDMLHDNIAGIGPRFPSLTQFDWDRDQEYVSYPLRGLVPFDGDGHWHLCLDYRQNRDAPSITYVDVECDHQTPIADSFDAYLDMLQLDIGEAQVLESVPDIEAVKARVAAALSVRFDPPDSYDQGFPVHRASLGVGPEMQSEWLFFSPNRVPRGFVRPDDPAYALLKDSMPGEADLHAGLPANSYTAFATDAARFKVVIEVCRGMGLTVRPLREYTHD